MNRRQIRDAGMRRRQLVAKVHLQRAQLAAQLKPVAHAMESADAGMRIVRRVGQHPEWLAAASAALILLTPRRLSVAFRAGTQALRTWRALAPRWRALLQRAPPPEK